MRSIEAGLPDGELAPFRAGDSAALMKDRVITAYALVSNGCEFSLQPIQLRQYPPPIRPNHRL